MRPHVALALAVPARRYRVSPRPYPAELPPVPYGSADHRRRVGLGGRVSFHGRPSQVPKGLRGELVAIRPTATDGCWTVHFLTDQLATVDLRKPAQVCKPCPRTPVNHLSGLDTLAPWESEASRRYARVSRGRMQVLSAAEAQTPALTRERVSQCPQ